MGSGSLGVVGRGMPWTWKTFLGTLAVPLFTCVRLGELLISESHIDGVAVKCLFPGVWRVSEQKGKRRQEEEGTYSNLGLRLERPL